MDVKVCLKCQRNESAIVHSLEGCDHSFCDACIIHYWKENDTETRDCPDLDCPNEIPKAQFFAILSLCHSDSSEDLPIRQTQSEDLSLGCSELPICEFCDKPVFLGRNGTSLQPCQHTICFMCQEESFIVAKHLNKSAKCPAYCGRKIRQESMEVGRIDISLCDTALHLLKKEKNNPNKTPKIETEIVQVKKPLEIWVSIYQQALPRAKILCPRGVKLLWLKAKVQETLAPETNDWELYIERELKDVELLGQADEDSEEVEVELEQVDLSRLDIPISLIPIHDQESLIIDLKGSIADKILCGDHDKDKIE